MIDIIASGLIVIVFGVNFLWKENIIKALERRIKEQASVNSTLTKYCLTKIKEDAVSEERQDYETAHICQYMLDWLEQNG